ncbi:MAG TPA: DUF58 domain-containing protein [Egibacteraceae bacterium]|nr:DUF58 domain-containing protein [Egibacteraceae bacterium]
MTARGISLVVASVLLWGLGRTLGLPELFVVAASSGALVGVAGLAVWLSTATVAARRVVGSARLPAGARTDVRLELRSDSWLPSSLLLVEDQCHYGLRPPHDADPPRVVVAGLAPGRTVSFDYELAGQSRGRYTVGPLSLRIRDPFGLVERVRRYPGTDEVLVLPRIEVLGEGITRGNHRGSEASDRRRLFTSGDEFYTLREYVTGDDLRQVHWPSTAHRATLMVRQQELPWEPEAVLFCDTRARAHHGTGPDSTLEKAVSVTASLVAHLAERRYDVRLGTEADGHAPQAAGLDTLLDRLAELDASDVERLSPALSRLRGAEAGGLLAAIVCPPPGSGPVRAHPDVRALIGCGRRFSGRLAIVVAPGTGGAGSRSAELARVLTGAGWRAVTVGPRDALADAWPALVSANRRTATGVRG